ncbi:lysocardiolipin acyltransferase 1-like isoform X1 [Zophobas morio]|uniref:lysocardiolipin acyltransferase 1-like isoform X1 n=1 Tax=Zophobas morio TaxID=2755281 RepID=UPI0030837ED3
MFVCAYLGVIFLWAPAIPLLFIWPSLFRKHRDVTGASWLYMCAAVLEILAGVKYVFSGDYVPSMEKALIMSNHRNRLDWLFMWPWFARYGRLTNEKIVLKEPVKWIPGPGWATQLLCFLFLKRDWNEDVSHLKKWLNHFISLDYPLLLHIFPEGTNFSASSMSKSHAYSSVKRLNKYDYVLHPRVKGFRFIVQWCRTYLDSIYDVTIGYPAGLPESELDLLRGRYPREVHVHVKRFLMQELPSDEESLENWCKSRWEIKENMLREFYKEAKIAESAGKELPTFENKHVDTSSTFLMKFCLFFWLVLAALFSALLYYSRGVRWFFLAANIVFAILSMVRIGFDNLEIGSYTNPEGV